MPWNYKINTVLHSFENHNHILCPEIVCYGNFANQTKSNHWENWIFSPTQEQSPSNSGEGGGVVSLKMLVGMVTLRFWTFDINMTKNENWGPSVWQYNRDHMEFINLQHGKYPKPLNCINCYLCRCPNSET